MKLTNYPPGTTRDARSPRFCSRYTEFPSRETWAEEGTP